MERNALKLTKINFDNLENRNGEVIEFERIFIGDEGGITAYGRLSDWIKQQPAEKRYAGWDMRIYPRYEITKIEIN